MEINGCLKMEAKLSWFHWLVGWVCWCSETNKKGGEDRKRERKKGRFVVSFFVLNKSHSL